MARITDEEIEIVLKKAGFISVIVKQGYEEKRISISDVVSELKRRNDDTRGVFEKEEKAPETLTGSDC